MSDHRQVIEELTPESWGGWLHHPITAAFFGFLADQRDSVRLLAVHNLEHGGFDPNAKAEDANPNVVRGKLSMLTTLIELKVEHMQAVYRGEREEGQSE